MLLRQGLRTLPPSTIVVWQGHPVGPGLRTLPPSAILLGQGLQTLPPSATEGLPASERRPAVGRGAWSGDHAPALRGQETSAGAGSPDPAPERDRRSPRFEEETWGRPRGVVRRPRPSTGTTPQHGDHAPALRPPPSTATPQHGDHVSALLHLEMANECGTGRDDGHDIAAARSFSRRTVKRADRRSASRPRRGEASNSP
jgi:hypothetical protein